LAYEHTLLPLSGEIGEISPSGGLIVKRALAIFGSSWLANLLMVLMLYYEMAPYYGWQKPLTAIPASATTAITMPSGDHRALIIGLLFLSSGLFAFLPAWLLGYGPLRPEKDVAKFSETPKSIVAIQSPNGGGNVPCYKVVRGFAYPSANSVQLLVLAGPAGNRRWFVQPAAQVTRYEWKILCRFGNPRNAVTGWTFEVCAVLPKTRINQSEIKDIPEDATVSETITVTLDRSLSDETL
jgi:hypothetical protein